MKKMLSLLLVFALLLSTSTSAFAADGTEGGEQPQESEQQTTVTVATLDELQTAVAAAENGDTIALSAEIKLDGVPLETEKDITLVRADTYESGSFLRLKNGAVLSGFTMENYKSSTTVVCESSAKIEDCCFVGDSDSSETFIKLYALSTSNVVSISDCSFSGAAYSAISSKNNVQLTITDCTFRDNRSYTQGGAIRSEGTLILEGCTIENNYAISGGGVYCSGNLTITDCQFSGNQIESEKFGTDILSQGTLSLTDDPQDGAGYFEESTGTKIELPMSEYTGTAKLIWLTDEQAAEYFAPVEPEEPEEEPSPDDTENDEQDNGETPTEPPTTPSEPPNDDNGDDTPDDQQPPSEPQETPNDDDNADIPDDGKQDETDEDDNEPVIIYEPVYIRVPVYVEPEPVEPSFVCGDAVIDVSRSVVLEGYDDGLLHLEDGLTRAQFMTILYRLLDEETIERYETTDTVFADVAPDAWYCPYVNTIANAGIVCGTGNGNFDPDALLTWGHIITILSRFVEAQEYQLQNIQYDGWAADAIETAVAMGWITDHAAFNPDAAISRGELAYFVNYVLGLYR
ncbi:MAG: S-layer homology domain-containing protein [Clostridiales bacterium]|nr:S-layer homology domain-containing protein [Clostridiales bacterium]